MAQSNVNNTINEDDKIDVTLEADPPKDFTTHLADLQSKTQNLSRMKEKGLINEKTGSALAIREQGQINLTSSLYSQYKLNPNGSSIEQTMESNTVTVRKNFNLDELTINHHKLNPNLYELTDFKRMKLPLNQEAIVGNFCITGSVLVKAWEPNLKRYMLIRRPIRMPMFSNQLNVPDINTGLNISDPLKTTENILAQSSSGYQVNGAITDAKSLIGKEGVDRANPSSSTDNKNTDNKDTDNKNNTTNDEKKEENENKQDDKNDANKDQQKSGDS